MLANQLKYILHTLWQHKELVVIYCFEEYLCEVFLGAQVVSDAQFQGWTDYLMFAPYCCLLVLGLCFAHLARNKKGGYPQQNNTFQSLITRLQMLQKRFPVLMGLLSILMVLTGEIIEQQVLESLAHLLLHSGNAVFILLLLPLVKMASLAADFLICLPVLFLFAACFVALQIVIQSVCTLFSTTVFFDELKLSAARVTSVNWPYFVYLSTV